MAVVVQCYAVRGLEVVAAQNISTTITNLFNIFYIQLGACIAIVIGQLLGAGKKEEAKQFIIIAALVMPIYSFSHGSYFTLRSGGKTVITFLFDSGFTWCVLIPFAYCLVHFTNLPIVLLFFLVQATELLKVIVGFFMVRSEIWIQNIVGE